MNFCEWQFCNFYEQCSPPKLHCRRSFGLLLVARVAVWASRWRGEGFVVASLSFLATLFSLSRCRPLLFFSALFRHRSAPLLAAASAKRPLPKLATPQVPPFPCALVGAGHSTSSHRIGPCNVVFLAPGQCVVELGHAVVRALRSVSPSTRKRLSILVSH